MQEIFIHSHNIVSSLGLNSQENFDALKANRSGISMHWTGNIYKELPLSLIDKTKFNAAYAVRVKETEELSFFEQLLVFSAQDALSKTHIDASSKRTIFIISSTKGNVEELKNSEARLSNDYTLWSSAHKVANHFKNINTPIVVSNACVSGVMATNVATQLIESNAYDHAVVIGGDVVSDFVIAGFMSFMALSPKACKPFDGNRDGLSLGEAAGCLILSREQSDYKILGGANTNDANHISGPSRTAEGLYLAMENSMKEANIKASDIDFISAHGTATVYNDMMESIALNRHGMQHALVNSFKGYWGHTLGASGIIEIVASLKSMEENVLIKSLGFEEAGNTENINILTENTTSKVNTILKTAAGFGGANSSIIIQKTNM